MGGRGSRVEYRTDPAMLKQMQAMQAQMEKLNQISDRSAEQDKRLAELTGSIGQLQADIAAKDNAIKAMDAKFNDLSSERAKLEAELKEIEEAENDPTKLREHQDRVFGKFVDSIQQLNLNTDAVAAIASTREINVAFVGNVSVGKSTFINAYFGERKVDTGGGRTTIEPKDLGSQTTLVGKAKVRLWDVPGNDHEFTYWDMDKIAFLSKMHVLVVIFDNTVSYSFELIRVAQALGKAMVFVRNKVDSIDEEEADWQTELRKDEQMLIDNLHLTTPKVYGVSSRNAYRSQGEARKVQADSSYQAKAHPTFEWVQMQQAIEGVADQLVENYAHDVDVDVSDAPADAGGAAASC